MTERGYAMAALLIALSIMSLMMTAVLPVWKQTAQREKEAELIFRGQQYARAIGLYQRRMGPGTYPPSVDVLVEQRFLRKKYKDPITNGDFQVLSMAASTTQAPAGGAQAGRGQQPATPTTGTAATAARGNSPPAGLSAASGSGVALGGIAAVASKSTDKSIRIYNGATHYNEWVFRFVPTAQAPGGGGVPQRGGQQGQPAGRGQPPGPGGRGFGGPGGPPTLPRGARGPGVTPVPPLPPPGR
jgi:type II secretory pathway pseudopilin PulG